MATIKQWEQDIDGMSKYDAEKYDQAVKVLSGWKLFRSEYPELKVFGTMLNNHISEINMRYCSKCGQSWVIHNDDGSCIID